MPLPSPASPAKPRVLVSGPKPQWDLQQSRPAYMATMPYDVREAHERFPPIDQPCKLKTNTLTETKDYCVSELVPPADRFPQRALKLSRADYQCFKDLALSREERQTNAAAFKAERKAKTAAMALRRQASEKLIPQHSKQSDQDEAQEQTSPHVQQGNRMHLEEEEDEIKVKEKMIVDARYHVVLDAQNLKKKQMEKEIKQEEKCLDQSMEEEYQKAVNVREELKQTREQELIRERLQIKERKKSNKERKRQKKERERLAEDSCINKKTMKSKEQKLEQGGLVDQHILHCQKQKMVQEAGLEAQQEMVQLRGLQERTQDLQADKDKQSDQEEVQEQTNPEVQRASRMHMEGDKIKDMEKLAVDATCHAAQDAQFSEMKQVEIDPKQEEMCLDQNMEVKCQNAMQMQEELEQERQPEVIRGSQIKKQGKNNMEERKRRQKERDALEESFSILRNMLKYKKQKLEQGRLYDQCILDYQKQTMIRLQGQAQEAEFEALQEDAYHEKQVEMAQLRGLQERTQDLQTDKDMLWAMWKQEAKEQEWWHRDLLAKNEKLMKIMELQVMLQQSRMEYMAHKLLMQAKRDRSHFEEFFRVEREEREAKRAEYGEAVQCQMQEHQAQLVQEQAACFEDEKHLQKEIQWHADRIVTGLPEIYHVGVEHKAFKPGPKGPIH
ncbi:hypothetical protein Y1Q_0018387 [Alligator mississippiensis]|uniref:Trichohyalin-like n=1 Tax=Alligator mississippiensis TaxID=8496 RepID=A0A151PCB3_ALLMI|nr:hypothetical protein Y1Q_0018387 [Alligator mississippiensis]